MTIVGCNICEKLKVLDALPASENVYQTDHWAVVHAFNTAQEGWLVLLSKAHVLSLAELQDEAVQELGLLQKRLTQALQSVLGAYKTYSVAFAEQGPHGDYRHLHIHIIPRFEGQDEFKGPNVFKLLGVPDEQIVPQERRNELAHQLKTYLD